MFRRSRELENALALLSEMGPKVEALEQENERLKAKVVVYETQKPSHAVDDPLTRESFTFAQQHQQIEDLKAELKAMRQEVATEKDVIKKVNAEKAGTQALYDEMRATFKPVEEERNRLQVQVRERDAEIEALRREKEAEVTRVRNEGYARATQLQMEHKDEVERLSNDLTKAMRERDIFATKLQQGLASLTAAINEVQEVEDDVRASPP